MNTATSSGGATCGVLEWDATKRVVPPVGCQRHERSLVSGATKSQAVAADHSDALGFHFPQIRRRSLVAFRTAQFFGMPTNDVRSS